MNVNYSLPAAIMCLGLPDPTNGTVTFSADGPASFMLATVATYNCEPGYVLNSINTTRTCVDLSNEANPVGTWNGDAPTCSGWLVNHNIHTAIHIIHYIQQSSARL